MLVWKLDVRRSVLDVVLKRSICRCFSHIVTLTPVSYTGLKPLVIEKVDIDLATIHCGAD
jgi:hypothetical protein